MKQEGSMTVFFCLITVLIAALIGTCLESARTAGLRFMAQTASGSALQSVFAEYHEELWERYHVFFRHEPDGLEGEIEEYLRYYIEPDRGLADMPEYTDFWNLALTDVEVTENRTMVSEGGRLFLEQAVEYEQYQVAANLLELFLDQVGLLDEVEKLRSFVAKISSCFEQIQLITVLYQDVRNLIVDVKTGVEVLKRVVNTEISSLEELYGTIQDVRELYERLNQSVSNYLESTERIEKLADELKQEYGGEAKEVYGEQISQLDALTQIGEIGGTIFRLGDQLKGICEQLSTLESQIKEKLESENIPEMDSYMKEVQEQLQNLAENSFILMQEVEHVFTENESVADQEDTPDSGGDGQEEETEKNAEEGEGLLDSVRQWKNAAILSLVLGADANRTELDRISDVSLLPSKMVAGELSEVTVEEKALFVFYISDTFTSWRSEEQGTFAYQQEYILFGKTDSRSNLTAMAERLLAVREGMNLTYLLSNTEMRELTKSVAYALVGATGLYPLVVITQFVLLAAWAFAEAVSDVKDLFRGESVEIWKTEESWNTSLNGLVSTAYSQPKSVDLFAEGGLTLSYEDYLRIFMFLNSTQKVCVRSLDMIQEDIRGTESSFLVADCYGQARATVKFSSPYRLITLPFIGIASNSGHQLIAKVGYQYQ